MITIFTDAACTRKGGHQASLHKKAKTGWAYVVIQDDEIIEEKNGRFEPHAPTILVELHAIREAMNSQYAKNSVINTDCEHVAKLFAGYKIAFADKPSTIKAVEKAKELGIRVFWNYGHDGSKGFTRADTLARDAIGLPSANAWGHL